MKSQTITPFTNWVTKFLWDSVISKKKKKAGIWKALNIAKTVSIQWKHDDLEFFISSWSIDNHTFATTWEEFGPTLEDVVAFTCLPMFWEKTNAIRIILDETGEKKLEAVTIAYSGSKTSNKSTHNSWLSYFETGKRWNSEIKLEAMLSYWLSWYILLSGPKDGLNSYIFPSRSYWQREKI